jgi:cellulose synthase/poly-beta-1,6-N-acetylglucosamine synthase-like glycosyltransferase
LPEPAVRQESARDEARDAAVKVRDEPVLVGRRRAAFVVLSVLLIAAVGVFAQYWFTLPDARVYPVLYALATLGVFYLVAVWVMPWAALARMQRPVYIPPKPGWRVAAITTFTPPLESIEMLEQTLTAMVAMDYPHDSWVLDEGDVPEVRALCARLGVRHFTRRDRPDYQAPVGPYTARTKFGNLNAWLAEPASRAYELLAAFDPDHVPERNYLTRTLGYFSDPNVGYVQPAQFYYNQEASFVARGAAEESYDFYSSGQMAAHAFGEPTIVGSHTVHRMSALRELGGVPPHEAEDVYLTLLYKWGRWRGIYVPEILAMGMTPVDWRAYTRQQRRWARALLDLKLRVLPKVAPRMTFGERIVSLVHGTYFLRPLVLLVLYPMVIYMLIANVQPTFYHRYVFYAVFALAMVFFGTDRFRQLFYLDRKREKGIHWRSLVLQYAKWPYFAQALWQAVRGWRGAFTVTPKMRTRSAGRGLALPHVMLSLVMAIALAVHIARYGAPRPALLGSSLGFIGFSLVLASTDMVEPTRQFDRARYTRRRVALETLIGAR